MVSLLRQLLEEDERQVDIGNALLKHKEERRMTRTVTLREYLIQDILAELNRRARERGEDVEIVLERPKPQPVAERKVVPLERQRDG
jgi:hypothetical protein